jgi:hypothetical protein
MKTTNILSKMALTALFSAGVTLLSIGQTNTFPSTGAAGIGTTSPASGTSLQINSGVSNSLYLYGTNSAPSSPYYISSPGITIAVPAGTYAGTPQFTINNQGTNWSMGFINYPGPNNRFFIGQNTNVTGLPGTNEIISMSNGKQYFGNSGYLNNTGPCSGQTFNFAGSVEITSLFIGNPNYNGTACYYNTSLDGINISIPNGQITSYSSSSNTSTITSSLVIGSLSANTTPMPSGYKLYVQSGILTEKLKVALISSTDWSDYVFNKDYKLTSLEEVEKYIQTNHHLPNVPSAEEVVKSGIDVAKMDAKLLEKIEELTLYMIALKKENADIKKELQHLKSGTSYSK